MRDWNGSLGCTCRPHRAWFGAYLWGI